ncbi:MAG: ATP-dependent DNA ligase [Patescibacteria group bacterium]|nr:ATP-dependent DNA ligase [Patescibacteria group bacterium]MCL5431880.1 ATP-dependent DNA ligase [Patescibacteria group bacterium]
MTFSKLAEYFSKLESTASRNNMVEILAQLFAEAGTDEIDKIAYLLQGRVAPLFEPIEFGMADRMVIRALAKAYGVSGEKVTQMFKKSGDLGETAQELRKGCTLKQGATLQVGEVFEKLTVIADSSGEGSVEKKIGLLADLLAGSDGLSARYIARIPVDKLRLGFSDMTMLEGLSWMIDGTKKHKDNIEAAYDVRPDLGVIAQEVKQRGANIKIEPKVGTPILVMRAERLASTAEILEKMGGKCAVEPKLDGLRTQLHFIKNLDFVRLFSRGLEDVTAMYPDLVAAAKKEIAANEVILDGEAIGFDPKTGKYLPFQETVQRKRKYDVAAFAGNVPLRLVVFDCLYLNGESLINKPYGFRRKIVEEMLKRFQHDTIIIPAEMEVVQLAERLEALFQQALNKNLEGIMVKKLDGVYQAGARGWNWIKLKGSYTKKLNDTIDAVVMGYDFGQGKRNKFGVGSFLIGVYDKKTDSYKTISKVGTGLTDKEWRDLKIKSQKLKVKSKPNNYDVNKLMVCDEWLEPQIVGEFRADELTKSPMHTAGYALRFPRLERWREKNPEDTTSLKEILEMVKLQKS